MPPYGRHSAGVRGLCQAPGTAVATAPVSHGGTELDRLRTLRIRRTGEGAYPYVTSPVPT